LKTLPIYLAERWRGKPFDPETDFELILPWSRGMDLVFWWLLLFYGWRAGHEIGGSWAARLAVVLLACEPSLLAHASLATTDIAVSACLIALACSFRSGHEQAWHLRIGLPALWFAACVLTKASGLVFGTTCLIVMELERVIKVGAVQRIISDLRARPLGHGIASVFRRHRDLLQIMGLACC